VSGAEHIVIHAGLPKTGTTYLQQRFAANHAWLAGHGIDYPTLGRERTPGHHGLARRCRDEPVDESWAALPLGTVIERITAGPAARVLLSSETFSSLTVGQARQLRAALGPREVTWVVYVRRRSALCASRWQEEVKHGSACSFADYLAAQVLGQGDVLRPEDAILLGRDAFGVPALRVVVYDSLAAGGVDLFDHFVARILGLAPAGAVPAAQSRVNVGLPPEVVELLRTLNAVRADGLPSVPDGRQYVRAAERFLAEHERGQALRREASRVFAAGAEPVSLAALDRHWRHVDHEIRRLLGDAVLAPASATELFDTTSAVTIRVLRPGVLQARIPLARWRDATRAIAASRRPR
jgi:hypothetical protein